MDLNLTEQQEGLAVAVRDFCTKVFPPAQRTASAAQAFQRDNWQDLCALGVACLELDESRGGSAMSLADTHVAVAELGRALLTGHLLELAWRPLAVLRRLPCEPGVDDMIRQIAESAQRWVVAKAPTQSTPCFVAAPRTEGGWQLKGSVTLVPGLDVSDGVLVWASQSTDGRPMLFKLPVSAFDEVDFAESLDGDRLGAARANGLSVTPADLLASGEVVSHALNAADEAYCALLTVEIAAIVSELLDMCLEFVRTRQQFGRPLADFQALQHQLADFYLQAERSVSVARLAVAAIDDQPPGEATLWVSAASQIAGSNARLLGERAVQLHGAMGFTDECRVAPLVRRALVATARLGSPSWHLDRFDRLRSAAGTKELNA